MEEQEQVSFLNKKFSHNTIIAGLLIIISLLVFTVGILVSKNTKNESLYGGMNQVEIDMIDRMKCFSNAHCTVVVYPQGIKNGHIVQYLLEVDCPQNPSDILDRCGILPIGQPSISEE